MTPLNSDNVKKITKMSKINLKNSLLVCVFFSGCTNIKLESDIEHVAFKESLHGYRALRDTTLDRITTPMGCFRKIHTASRTLAGIELMNMIKLNVTKYSDQNLTPAQQLTRLNNQRTICSQYLPLMCCKFPLAA